MSEPGAHPQPPPDLDQRTPLIIESSGPWMRIHPLRREPIYFSLSRSSRFSDPLCQFGVLYAADDLHGAFIETHGRDLDVRSISSTRLMSAGLARIETARPLRLVDVASSGGLARLGADGRLTTGAFDVAQAWSRALWAHPVAPDGIYYRLRHDQARCGCAVYDRARGEVRVVQVESLWDPHRRADLADVLNTYGFGLIVE